MLKHTEMDVPFESSNQAVCERMKLSDKVEDIHLNFERRKFRTLENLNALMFDFSGHFIYSSRNCIGTKWNVFGFIVSVVLCITVDRTAALTNQSNVSSIK